MCTCGVPKLSSTACFSDEDCLLSDSQSKCLLINYDLLISLLSVACDQCQYEHMCYHTSQNEMCVCACDSRCSCTSTCAPPRSSKSHARSRSG
jgi:hypothetical protein